MSGNKARRRALETADAIRINTDVPLIVDRTVLITPELAREMLKNNKNNRPINWKKVEEYAAIMKRGEWILHAQGIVLDSQGNILTGQKRLWAVVYSGVNVYFRVSTGNPVASARLLDRGTPQTARDLASRDTEQKHSPTESSLARAILMLKGVARPSVDDLARTIADYSERNAAGMRATAGTKKTRVVLMVLATISEVAIDDLHQISLLSRIEKMTEELTLALLPSSADECWGKGAAFAMAMAHARRIVEERR